MPALILPLVEVMAYLPVRGALIGLDLGTKTIGVASSDPDRRLAAGVETITRKNFSADAARLLVLAAERQAVAFVLGLPLNMDGTEGKSPLEFNGNSIDRATKVKWDGAKLVLTTAVSFNGQTFETVQVWALDATGNLVIDSTRPDFQGGGAPVKSSATYKKG